MTRVILAWYEPHNKKNSEIFPWKHIQKVVENEQLNNTSTHPLYLLFFIN